MSGPNTGELAMRGDILTSDEIIALRDELNGVAPDQSPLKPSTTKHKRPALKIGLESEDGKTYLALTDHESGNRATLYLSPEAMASLGSQMLTVSAGDGLGLQCWLDGELEVAK